MVITRSGANGVGAVARVMEEHRIALAHAPIPYLQTGERTAANWGQQLNRKIVTHLSAIPQSWSFTIVVSKIIK